MASPTQGNPITSYGQPVNVGTYINFTATDVGTTVKTGEGVLFSITFNNPVATDVVTLYDGTSTGGTKIATITIPASPMPVTLSYNVFFSTGLFVVSATAGSDLTISYR